MLVVSFPLSPFPFSLPEGFDSKAKVKIGNLSRGGKDRSLHPLQADDHDSHWTAVLVPFGILDVLGKRLSMYFGQSAKTSDFIVDCKDSLVAGKPIPLR